MNDVLDVTADTSRLTAAFESLPANVPEALLRIRDDVLGLLEDPGQAITAKMELRPAGGATHAVLVFQPSDRLLELLAALRAVDCDSE